jgi:hypothetical protein
MAAKPCDICLIMAQRAVEFTDSSGKCAKCGQRVPATVPVELIEPEEFSWPIELGGES